MNISIPLPEKLFHWLNLAMGTVFYFTIFLVAPSLLLADSFATKYYNKIKNFKNSIDLLYPIIYISSIGFTKKYYKSLIKSS